VKKKPNGEAKKLRTPAYRPRRTPTKAEKEIKEARKERPTPRADYFYYGERTDND
jgi:hypothetical protein